MSSDSFSYLASKSRSVVKHWKFLALFGLVFLMLLPYTFPAPSGASTPLHVSTQAASIVSPSVSQDFSIVANPTSITTTRGSTKTVQLAITGIGGFTGQVYMSASSFSFPEFPVSLNPPIVSLSSGTATSALTITVPSNASPGPNTVFIDSTGGCTLFHFLDISVNVNAPDFTITSEKSQMTLAQGGSNTAKIDLTSLNSFSGSVSLFSFSQFTTSLNPTSVTLTPSGTSSSTLTITAPVTLAPGNYTVGVEGSSGSLFHSAEILVTVTGPSIALDASRHFLTLIAGGASNSSTITVTALGGFTGQVTLAASPATPLAPSLSAPTVTVPPTGSSVLIVTAPVGTKAQSYLIDITGTSGSVKGSTFVDVQVKQPDFEISTDPFFIAVVAGGSSCASTVSLTSVLGFTANVGLTLKGSPSVTATLSTASVNVPGTSTLTISAPSGAVPGFYSLEVNGTSVSPARTHSASLDVLVIGPDFSVSASPDPVTVMAGSSGTSTVSLNPILGFSNPVNLVASSFDPQLTVSVSPTSITPGTPATLIITPALGTVPGNFYSVQVNATSGQITHSIYVSITVTGPGFYLTANPPALTVNAGPNPQMSTITVTPTNGFNSPVNLFASPDSANLNASIVPSTVASGSYTATLSVNSTIPGSYKVDIFGSSGLLSNDTSVTVTVVGPDFSLSDSPPSLTITAGGSQISTITINPVGGFNSPVALTANAPPGITATFSPTSITPPAASSLTIAVDSSMTPGAYTVDIHGSSGPIDRLTQLTVNVVGFNLAASPDIFAIVQGATQTSTITVTAQNGFTGTVALTDSAPAGLTASLSPTSILGSGTSTLTITASNIVGPGSYTVAVKGTSGLLTQTATVTITVPPPDFSLSASPTAVTVNVGATATSTVAAAQVNGFLMGTVALTSAVSPASLTCSLSPTSIALGTTQTSTLSCSSPTVGTYTVTITGTSGSLTHTAAVTYTVQDFSISATSPTSVPTTSTATSTITIAGLNGFNGAVSLTDTVQSPLSCTVLPPTLAGSGTATLSCSSTIQGAFTATIAGTSGSLSHSATATFTFVTAPDFTITATSPAAVNPGTSATSTITITAVNGFTGTVTITGTVPTNLSCGAITPASVTNSGTATISCSSTVAATYALTVTGTVGSLTHSTTATFTVRDFTIAATSPAAAPVGTSITSTITIAPLNGFTGAISLADTIPAYLTCSAITPTSITNSGTASLACSSTIAGTYAVTVTATSGGLTHSSIATFTVTDFTVTATSPAAVSVTASAVSAITVTAVNGFTGTVSLTDSPQTYLTCTSISPTSLANSGTATVSCSSTIAGTYTLTITGTSGSLHHIATAKMVITAAATPDFALNASPTSVTIQAGNSGTSTITITSSNRFTGTVALSVTSSPTGPTTSFATTSVLGGSGTSILTISVASGVAAGTYTITVQGTSGTQSHTTQVSITVTSAPTTQPAASAPTILGLSAPLFYGLIGVLIAIVIGAIVVMIRRKNP
jgi:uncharacterized membrane protein